MRLLAGKCGKNDTSVLPMQNRGVLVFLAVAKNTKLGSTDCRCKVLSGFAGNQNGTESLRGRYGGSSTKMKFLWSEGDSSPLLKDYCC